MDVELPLPLVSILIALIALWVAVKNYQRKHGLDMRGGFSICSSVDCGDVYIDSVLIENVKDRSATIFAIYLQVGRSVYLELVDFGMNPRIIRPFETFNESFGPTDFYVSNFSRFNINELLRSDGVSKRLVCSTSAGKYVVPSNIRRWSPIVESFSNFLTGVVRPARSEYKGRAIGGNVAYILDLKRVGGDDSRVLLLRRDSYHFKFFENFALTEDALKSRDALIAFLQCKKGEGVLGNYDFEVLDAELLRQKKYGDFNLLHGDAVVLREHSLWNYYIVGRWVSFWNRRSSSRRLRKMLSKPRRRNLL